MLITNQLLCLKNLDLSVSPATNRLNKKQTANIL